MAFKVVSAHLRGPDDYELITYRLMQRLKHQLRLTGIVVTHDLDLMRNVADRVVVLFEGRAIYFGPVADLENSDHPHIQEFLAMDRV